MEELKKIRKNSKMTQQEVADKLAIKRSTYASYENSTNQPTLDTLKKLASLFDVSLDMLLGRPRPYDFPSSTTQKQKDVFKLILNLDDKNCEKVEFFIAGLIAGKKDHTGISNNLNGEYKNFFGE